MEHKEHLIKCLNELRIKMYDELDIPNPIDLLNKQTELEHKQIELEQRKNKLLNKQIELEQRENLIKQREDELIVEKRKHKKLSDAQNKLINALDNKLPKVAEKNNLKSQMVECICSGSQLLTNDPGIQRLIKIVEDLMIDGTEYIVYYDEPKIEPGNPNYKDDGKVIITNKGKIFFISIPSHAGNGYRNDGQKIYYYLDCDIISDTMNKIILQALIHLTDKKSYFGNGHIRTPPLIAHMIKKNY